MLIRGVLNHRDHCNMRPYLDVKNAVNNMRKMNLFQILQADIDGLTEAEAKGFLLLLLERQPDMVHDVIRPDTPAPEQVPPPEEPHDPPQPPAHDPPPPDWCVCTRCRDMTQDVAKLCCNMQPQNCLSLRPVRSKL